MIQITVWDIYDTVDFLRTLDNIYVVHMNTRANINHVENIFNKYNLNFQNIGKTNNSSILRINESINLELKKAKTLWENGLRNKLK